MTQGLPFPLFEFHISRAARERYGFADSLFSLSGNVVLANLAAVRAFTLRINNWRAEATPPEPALNPGDLNAMGLVDEVFHFVIAQYQKERDPRSVILALDAIDRELGPQRVDQALTGFLGEFPPVSVHHGTHSAAAWLAESSAGVPHRALALEELLMLRLANENPAIAPFRELLDDRTLPARAACTDVLAALERWMVSRPRYGPYDQFLIDMLRSPAREHPESLTAQLEYIRRNWGYLLGDLLVRLLTGLDVLAEEAQARWMRMNPTDWGRLRDSGADSILRFGSAGGAEHEPERFSPDRDWMPRVVLLAKSAFVWLDQLSKTYGRDIRRLDQIPDEELDRLARWGVTGVWLIGVWERSCASQRIKQLCGNPDAAASAYSLLGYSIAGDLGGEAALDGLRARALARGIKLASDMVPNHMGIDSHWVIEHPDWFLQASEPPFPAYTFNGPDLSHDEHVSIQIEDHYYDRSDASVVFKRTERSNGHTRYVYHGNDGTSFPWNDTAQLDYLNPAVREAVIQTILHVARQFPIIRFDAAMTLAKKHYQRLWFPEPGSGGAIPSRAEHGLTKAQFDRVMPHEFWREVVDRAAIEAPDTLLLAEAFWLMEGYFVRTLGMHRVYNSAFMNMLRDEQNANYRTVIKNTLEFDPEILKRYVNFMSNPDERTSVDQFAKGDKYFGVCTLMATLPGLPMFGHGQVEGFEERYGMEYRRAYQDERPDRELVERHEREIFPLLHRRHVFAEVADFQLYDFFTESGGVNENVFAYSNRRGDERALVLVHNAFADTTGWVRVSAATMRGMGAGKSLVQRSLSEGLGISDSPGAFTRYRDFVSGLEYLKPSRELCEQGMRFELRAYDRRVLLDFREVHDSADAPWGQLAHELSGRGVANLDDALDEIRRRVLSEPFGRMLAAETLHGLAASGAAERPVGNGAKTGGPAEDLELLDAFEHRLREFLDAAATRGLGAGDTASSAREVRGRIEALLTRAHDAVGVGDAVAPAWGEPRTWGALLAYEALRGMGGRASDSAHAASSLAREWRLDRALQWALEGAGVDGASAWRGAQLTLALLENTPLFGEAAARKSPASRVFTHWLTDDSARRILDVHVHENIEWFSKESFEQWLGLLAAVCDVAPGAWLTAIQAQAVESGWRTDRLVLEAVAMKPARKAAAELTATEAAPARKAATKTVAPPKVARKTAEPVSASPKAAMKKSTPTKRRAKP